MAALVTALLAVRLFQEKTRDDTLADLQRQAAALADLYADSALELAGAGPGRPGVRGGAARAGDGDDALLRGPRPLPRRPLWPARARRGRGAGSRGARRGPAADLRVRAARRGADVPRRRASARDRRPDLRRARGREAARRASRASGSTSSGGSGSPSSPACSWPRRSSGTSRAGSPRPCSRSRGRPTEIAQGRYDVELPPARGTRRDRPADRRASAR